MEVIKVEGEDRKLYSLVGHLVMNEAVLEYNLKYPFRTGPEYCWFVALNGSGRTVGFIPAKRQDGKAVINNYYVASDDTQAFAALLSEAVRTLGPDFEIEAVVQTRHIPHFERNGFCTTFHWKRYAKMKVFKNEEECL